jgi:hypothetical protein
MNLTKLGENMRTANSFQSIAAAVLAAIAVAASGPAHANIVYIGTDLSDHYPSHPEAVTLARNAVTWAGGSANPTVLLVGNGSSFGGTTPALLSLAGFTLVTQIAPAALAGTDLSLYDVVYFAPTTSSADVAAFSADAAAIAAYAAAGGGLVVEPEVFATGSWSWVPFFAGLGSSGAANVGGDAIHITAPGDPVMAGLTDAGLSGWGFSIHSTFTTPGAAGFDTLATGDRVPYIISLAVPEPGTLALLGLGAAGLAAFRRRRPQSSST